MAEYLAHLLNSGHSDRQHVQDVLDEYLFQSDGSEGDTLYDDTESVAPDEEDLAMTVDEGFNHFQKWKNG